MDGLYIGATNRNHKKGLPFTSYKERNKLTNNERRQQLVALACDQRSKQGRGERGSFPSVSFAPRPTSTARSSHLPVSACVRACVLDASFPFFCLMPRAKRQQKHAKIHTSCNIYDPLHPPLLTVFKAKVGRQVADHERCHRVQPLRLPDTRVHHRQAFFLLLLGRGFSSAVEVTVGAYRR